MGKLKQCFNQMLALHKEYIYTNRFDFFFIQAIYIHIYIYTQHMHFYVDIYIYISNLNICHTYNIIFGGLSWQSIG